MWLCALRGGMRGLALPVCRCEGRESVGVVCTLRAAYDRAQHGPNPIRTHTRMCAHTSTVPVAVHFVRCSYAACHVSRCRLHVVHLCVTGERGRAPARAGTRLPTAAARRTPAVRAPIFPLSTALSAEHARVPFWVTHPAALRQGDHSRGPLLAVLAASAFGFCFLQPLQRHETRAAQARRGTVRLAFT